MPLKKSKKGVKDYIPETEMRRILMGLLQYKDDLEIGVDGGKEHKRYLDKEKVKLLDKYVFESMANIMYFFRSVSRYPQLREIFEDDVKDLLGVRGKDPKDGDYGFIFSELVRCILLPGLGFVNKKEVEGKDFRLRLNQILLENIWIKMDLSLTEVFKNPAAQKVVGDDFNRAWAWVRMLAESTKLPNKDIRPPHRTITSYEIPLREDDLGL